MLKELKRTWGNFWRTVPSYGWRNEVGRGRVGEGIPVSKPLIESRFYIRILMWMETPVALAALWELAYRVIPKSETFTERSLSTKQFRAAFRGKAKLPSSKDDQESPGVRIRHFPFLWQNSQQNGRLPIATPNALFQRKYLEYRSCLFSFAIFHFSEWKCAPISILPQASILVKQHERY